MTRISSGLASIASLYCFFTSANLLLAISRMAFRSPKFIVPVGQVFTQAGSIPSLIRSMHMVHFAITPILSSYRGISYGQDSRMVLKSAAFTFTFGLKMTAPVASSLVMALDPADSAVTWQGGSRQCRHWSGKKYHFGSPPGTSTSLNLTNLNVKKERS